MTDQKQKSGQAEKLGASATGPLPRGRHGLPPDIVEAHQRQRVAAAVARILAEQGYAALTVERLQSEAGISRSTFYSLYSNKHAAIRQAYDLAFERFCASLAEAADEAETYPERVKLAVSMALAFAAEDPDQAQLLSGLAVCADPVLAHRVFECQDQLAQALCGSGEDASGMPDRAAQALVGAVNQVLARHLLAGENEALAELEAWLVTLALAPFIGRRRAAATAAGGRQ